jgi:toxin ParE1/3/4
MAFELEISHLAANEIINAFDWYESQKQGLGQLFLEALDEMFRVVLQNPYTFSYYIEPVREGKLQSFPYTVVYEVFDQSIVVYSVFSIYRDPGSKKMA